MKFYSFFIFICSIFAVSTSNALMPQDYAHYFEINLDEKLPSLSELSKKYAQEEIYDYKYDYSWNIEDVFDSQFRQRILDNGKREKRLVFPEEKVFVQMIESVPKELYPYIGPYMHTVPGIPEKVLNIPEIKATKNKFPEKIAPQLQNIPDIEFVSPSLYFILMPEAWPDNQRYMEMPNFYASYPKVEYKHDFYNKIKKLVPVSQFAPDAKKEKKVSRSDFRTVQPTQTSLLTAADVAAFADTLDGVLKFSKENTNFSDLHRAGMLLDMYEVDEKKGIPNNNQIKDMVNPCQRLVQKLQILGPKKEVEFLKIVAPKGFDLKTWAYTCDKTIKAYRLAQINRKTLFELKAYSKGLYLPAIRQYNLDAQMFQMSTMQAILEMYKAPMSDVIEVKKNRKILKDKFKKMDFMLVTNPIAMHY